MKKLITLLTACSISIAALSPITSFASDEIKVFLNGTQLDFEVSPVIIDDTTFVPMRKIFEALGAEVVWDGDLQTVYAYYPGGSISLPIGSFNIYRNTIEQIIDTPAFITDGTTLVPLRIVSEYMGCDVQWDGSTRSIFITPTNALQVLDWNDNYYYIGETENGCAIGYGALYSRADNIVADIGMFYDGYITNGTRYYDDGNFYFGSFKDGMMHKGTFYTETTLYKGDFSNGFNGTFETVNLITGGTSIVNLIDGVESSVVFRNQLEQDLQNIQNEIHAAESKLLEISQARIDFANKDIYNTSQAKKIKKEVYKTYGISENYKSSGSTDSFAENNARRQYEATKSKADALAYELILEDYQAQLNEYDRQYKYYQDLINTLNTKYNTTFNTYLNMLNANSSLGQ